MREHLNRRADQRDQPAGFNNLEPDIAVEPVESQHQGYVTQHHRQQVGAQPEQPEQERMHIKPHVFAPYQHQKQQKNRGRKQQHRAGLPFGFACLFALGRGLRRRCS